MYFPSTSSSCSSRCLCHHLPVLYSTAIQKIMITPYEVMKLTQDSGGVSGTRHILLFLCLLVPTEHLRSTDCYFAPLPFWLLEHPFLLEWWVIPTINLIDDTPDNTFIDRKSCKSLLASHLTLFSPETNECFLLKCRIKFQDISPLVYPVLQKHCRT